MQHGFLSLIHLTATLDAATTTKDAAALLALVLLLSALMLYEPTDFLYITTVVGITNLKLFFGTPLVLPAATAITSDYATCVAYTDLMMLSNHFRNGFL